VITNARLIALHRLHAGAVTADIEEEGDTEEDELVVDIEEDEEEVAVVMAEED
jgi:hypothetical protein